MSKVISKGIDVSAHNGTINWNKVKASGIDFVMIRAGYGSSSVDKNFIKNITGASAAGLNVGIYWFSYAYTINQVKLEADYCLKVINPYKNVINMPVCFDWEYDSENYAKKHGVTPNKSLVSSIAKEFLTTIENAGYCAMNYTNIDCMTRFFDSSVTSRFSTWIANWSKSCSYSGSYGIWQYGAEQNYIDSKYVDGISGVVDKDYCYVDYPSWYKNKNKNSSSSSVKKDESKNNTPASKPVHKPATPSSSFKVGDTVKLSNTPIYTSASSANSSNKKSGTFYIYSSEIINGKIRITNSKSNVGRTPIGNYVTGFVAVSSISKSTASSPAPAKKSYSKGTKIVLNKVPLYVNATTGKGKLISGTYWIYDGSVISGRLRITNSPSNVGRTPIGNYVTGFINKSDI